jgi:hypothetical protein
MKHRSTMRGTIEYATGYLAVAECIRQRSLRIAQQDSVNITMAEQGNEVGYRLRIGSLGTQMLL